MEVKRIICMKCRAVKAHSGNEIMVQGEKSDCPDFSLCGHFLDLGVFT